MKVITISGFIHREAHNLNSFEVFHELKPQHNTNNREFQNRVTVTVELSDEQHEEWMATDKEFGT